MFRKPRASMASPRVRAWTLVELLMVMVVIGAWAGVAAPRFAESLAHRRAENAIQRIARDITSTARLANTTSRAQTIAFSLVMHGYSRCSGAEIPDPSDPPQVRLHDEPYLAELVYVSFTGLNPGASGPSLTFDGFGRPTASGIIVIRVGKAYRYLVLDGSTGRLRTS